MAEWGFYGRTEPLAELRRVVEAERWYFCRIEGRRRIGKTTLLGQLAKGEASLGANLVYMQVPDSDERDVATTFARSLGECERDDARALAANVTDFASMADAIGQLCDAGMVVVLDEFQYFTRAKLHAFNSFLQAQVDRLRNAGLRRGGLFVLGSLQSEMNALLDDKAAPLYGRITAQIRLDHWDFQDLMAVFRSQGVEEPQRWLTLWTFFEGVPKFYHDAFEQDLFAAPAADLARELLTRMFVRGSSPLSEEADTWFLRELRGRAVSILHYLADHAGCSNGDLVTALNDPHDKTPLGTHISRLVNDYRMVDKLHPVFSDSKSRNARYYLADNFLQAWLAVAKPAREAARLKPLDKALAPALRRLEVLEGFSFEKLVRGLHTEMSRKGLGDFELSELRLGYWNRPRDVARSIEIDLVALDEASKRIRFGSCKRTAGAHDNAALEVFDQHVAGFMAAREHKHLSNWTQERVVFSPEFTSEQRAALVSRGYGCKDLHDYAAFV
ncbi:AAA family ATPase [Variovorax sp. LjRoot84]|uniref:ATP-binding protein n=1 Tax=Variovorax sp. LjRoot84 TaxID=3342340 RepID=UPI003ECE9F7D